MFPEVYQFGRAVVRPAERLVLVDGEPVALGARAFDVLLTLLENRDRLVTKNELLDRVWEGLVVDENNLQVQISALRKVLGPSSIATVPGRGYRFAQSLVESAPPVAFSEGAPQAQCRSNVPVAADVLIGRELALQELCTSLTHARLVSATGAGGIGKTRLAQAVSRAVVNQYQDGVWWVDLAALSSADRVVPAIAKAAQLRICEGEWRTELVRALGDRALLLVLDNCEHLSNAVAGIVSAILAGTENVRVLVTSREALKVRGESVYKLEPLALPPVGTSLAVARTCGAVQLLESRAFDIDRRFTLTEGNVAEAIDLCRRLDGIALAIELAAARVPLLGLSRLHQQLGDRLDLLRTSSRDSLTRHKSLRLTIDWSYSLLNEQEKTLLRRLSTFVGSFRIDVAQQCAASEELAGSAVLDALEGLLDKSLVKLEQLEPPRYRLLETTRVYAREQLARAGETDTLLRKHGMALASLAEGAMRERFSRPTEGWLDEYLPDYDDLAEAFDRAYQRRDADVAAATVEVLRGLDQHRTLAASSSRIAPSIELLPFGSAIGRARLHSFIASCGWVTVPQVSRADCAKQAVDLWRDLGDYQKLYWSLCVRATEAARIGAFDSAEDALREARELEDPAWPPRRTLQRVIHEGWVAYYRRDMSRSRDALRQATALASQEGERDLAASARTWLAATSLMAGDVDESIGHAREVVAELRGLNQREYLAFALTILSMGLLMEQDVAGAAAAISELLADRHEDESCPDGAVLLVASLAAKKGDGAASATLLGAAKLASTEDFEPITDRLLEDAAEAVDGLIGSTESARLQQAGALLRIDEASRLARDTLRGLMS